MEILAIDPGNTESAYVYMDGYNPINFGKLPNEELRRMIYEESEYVPNNVAIEMIASYGMAVGKEVFDTCVWIGRYTEAIHSTPGRTVDYIYRKDVKINICGSTKAKDSNIRQALIDTFAKHDFKNGKGTTDNRDFFYGFKADIWAAYAVGVTYLDKLKEATQ